MSHLSSKQYSLDLTPFTHSQKRRPNLTPAALFLITLHQHSLSFTAAYNQNIAVLNELTITAQT